MKKYVILTDTGSDLDGSLRGQFDIDYLPMHLALDGASFDADLDWNHHPAKEFYDIMREGKRFTSSLINVAEFTAAYEEYAKQGVDVLYIGTSSKISASIIEGKKAAELFLKDHPEMKIICIDSLRACYTLGMIVIRACELRAEGNSIEEVASWVEENKLCANMIGSVDKLTWLKMAGRVSATKAFFGALFNVKPIIIADAIGQNYAEEKVKGRKSSLVRIAEKIKEAYLDLPYQRIFISHADCYEEALELKDLVLEAVGNPDVPVHIGYVGPGVGSAVGPGMISAFCWGKKVEVNKPE